ncbi:MAG: kelch repeat-containing protein, partial [Elusimicrobiota bacterium]
MTGLTMRRLSTALCATFILAALPGVSPAAVPEQRVAHTATLLTTGDILIAGGIKEDGTALNSAELVKTSNGTPTVATGNIDAAVSRASHTATLLSNGCVLIAGGNIALSTTVVPSPTATARVYDPDAGIFSAADGMNVARYNHTATLLNDGRVLVCGGQDAAGAAIIGADSCEFYTAGATCADPGAFTTAPNILQGRYNHTATLLKDGRVWFAGGRNPLIVATGGYLSTTERFDPISNTFQSASPLIEARAHHTPTLMGDGKALVVGGYNNRQLFANYGMTESAEIYDPISNSVAPAAVLAARRMGHSSVLSANGEVTSFGGLGNITTTYINPSIAFEPGSIISFNAPAAPFASINGTTGLIPITFPLSTEVSGEIMDGEIWMSSPTVHPSWGMINFTTATPYAVSAGGVGLRISMNGFEAGCLPDGSQCGIIDVQPAGMSQMTGQVIFYRRKDVQNSDSAGTTGTINFIPATIDTTTPNGTLDAGSSVTADLTIAMADGLIGSNLRTGTLTFKSGTIIRGNAFTVTLTGASDGTIAGTYPIVADTNGAGTTDVTVTFPNLVGTIKYDANSGSLASGEALGAVDAVNVTVDMIYTTDGANLNGESFRVDVATVVVRKMIFSDTETYNPKANSWTLAPPPGSSPSDHRYGHSATLLPNNDTVFYGGRACNDATCTTTAATPGIRRTLVFSEDNFGATVGASSQKRAFHTSTLLPNGKILVAGGTNGPSILSNAELFTPDTGLFSAVNGGGMRYVRDLHTATLMPNGRVLVAGGFTTNAASTGSTNSAEIYYPDVNRFVETSPMISSRSNHSAILLPDGRIFVAGGFGDLDVITGTAEIFLSTANRWMPVATMPANCERAIHATVQLKDGRIMLIGGVNASGPLDTTAVYNPGANTWD